MNWKHLLTVAAIGMALSWSSTAAAAERDGVMEIVRDIEIEMAGVMEHAAKLEQWVEWPNRYSLTSYRYEWSGITEHFNEAGELVPKLQKAADESKDWQKEVVSEIASLMKATEAQIEAARKHVFETSSVERIYADEMYALRVESIVHYVKHIDNLIEYMQKRERPMT